VPSQSCVTSLRCVSFLYPGPHTLPQGSQVNCRRAGGCGGVCSAPPERQRRHRALDAGCHGALPAAPLVSRPLQGLLQHAACVAGWGSLARTVQLTAHSMAGLTHLPACAPWLNLPLPHPRPVPGGGPSPAPSPLQCCTARCAASCWATTSTRRRYSWYRYRWRSWRQQASCLMAAGLRATFYSSQQVSLCRAAPGPCCCLPAALPPMVG